MIRVSNITLIIVKSVIVKIESDENFDKFVFSLI